MNICKKLLQVDRVHFEFICNASRNASHVCNASHVPQDGTCIRTTPTPLLLLFIPYKFFVRMMTRLRITKKKRKRGGLYKTDATKRLSFFLLIKAYVKRSDVACF